MSSAVSQSDYFFPERTHLPLQRWIWSSGWDIRPALPCTFSSNFLFSILKEATAKSKDGRIDQSDFLNYAASNSRYSLFTPMEASIVFHFAGRGAGHRRLALIDFAQLLDPKWRPPHEELETQTVPTTTTSFINQLLQSSYSFVQGGSLVLHAMTLFRFGSASHRNCWSAWGDNCVSDRYGYVQQLLSQ